MPNSKEVILAKIQSWCAYSERCESETLIKLRRLGAASDQAKNILTELIDLQFVNDRRFAEAFVSGKSNIKKWGRQKIARVLRGKEIATEIISEAIGQLDNSDYRDTLKGIAIKKWASLRDTDLRKRKQKLIRFLISKGYEMELVVETISKMADVR